jgi:hypothetical protein
MPIGRRNFLKSATMTTLSGGLALGCAELLFGQRIRDGEIQPRRPIPLRQVDTGDNFPIPFEAQLDALFYFRPSTFRPYVGDIFQAPNARGEMITMELLRVSEYKMAATTRISTKKTRQPQAFSLTFTASEPLPQFTSIHKVSHPALGTFDLFLTSRVSEDGTFLWEAVFNHLQ